MNFSKFNRNLIKYKNINSETKKFNINNQFLNINIIINSSIKKYGYNNKRNLFNLITIKKNIENKNIIEKILENEQLIALMGSIVYYGVNIIGKKRLGTLLFNSKRVVLVGYINYITEKVKIIKEYLISFNPLNLNIKPIEEPLINEKIIIKAEPILIEKLTEVTTSNSYINYIIGGVVLIGIGLLTYYIYKQFIFDNKIVDIVYNVKLDEYSKLNLKLLDLLNEHKINFQFTNSEEMREKYIYLLKELVNARRVDDASIVQFFLINLETINEKTPLKELLALQTPESIEAINILIPKLIANIKKEFFSGLLEKIDKVV